MIFSIVGFLLFVQTPLFILPFVINAFNFFGTFLFMPLADKVHFYILSVIQFKQMMGRNLIGSVQKFAIPAQPHRKGRFRLYIIGKQPALILQRIQVE